MNRAPTAIEPGLRVGELRVPPSKSHAHRVLIAEFLSGRTASIAPDPLDCDDVAATKRCLKALADQSACDRRLPVELDVGESGTTRRLLGPLVAALGFTPRWLMRGRLAERPQLEYPTLASGLHELPGDVSSQFVSGLLFALPLLSGESEIRLTTPLASRGYVELTLQVLSDYGVTVTPTPTGFLVPGDQRYVAPPAGPRIEGDWSSAAFVFALKALGNEVAFAHDRLPDLREDSLQPDRVVVPLLARLAAAGPCEIDIDASPDLFPVLAVVAAARRSPTHFVNTRRLHLKESDRIAAMADVLSRFGVETEVTDGAFVVRGSARPFRGGAFRAFGDHRIALAVAVGATRAERVVELDDIACAAKSYPTFFTDFSALSRKGKEL